VISLRFIARKTEGEQESKIGNDRVRETLDELVKTHTFSVFIEPRSVSTLASPKIGQCKIGESVLWCE